MSRGECQYRVPAAFEAAALVAGTRGRLHVQVGNWRDAERRYLDTADWRVHGSGGLVIEEATEGESRLTWRSRSDGRILATYSGYPAQRFAATLPPGSARQRLEKILEMRALLPMAELSGRTRGASVLDRQDKVVARLVEEQWWADGSAVGKPAALGLRLIPVKGYEADFDQLRSAIEQTPGVAPAADDPFRLALAAAGRAPGDFSPRLDVALAPDERSDTALRRILSHLLANLEATEAGLVAELDSEFLHDFRVAVRRARSALGQLEGVLPKEPVEALRAQLSWLGQATGPARDIDVYLLELEGYRDALAPELHEALDPLRELLRGHRAREQAGLVRLIGSRRYKGMKQAWRRLADAASGAGPRGATPVLALSVAGIHRAHRRVLRRGGRIGARSKPEQLHELRKDCKKLRYLLEIFRRLYSRGEIRRLVKSLRRLQDNLGTFQDCQIQSEQLQTYARQMTRGGVMAPGTQAAIGALTEGLAARQAEGRKAFAGCFEAFVAKPPGKRLERPEPAEA